MKLLLASGCSYTDKNFQSMDSTANVRGGWPMWPELMAKQIGLKSINMGSAGACNQTIFNNIIDGISQYGDEIDTIAVLWTSFDRTEFLGKSVIPLAELHISNLNKKLDSWEKWMEDRPAGDAYINYLKNEKTDIDHIIKIWCENSLRYMSLLADICELKGYKLLMAQGLHPLQPKPFNVAVTSKKITQEMIISRYVNNLYFKNLEKKRSVTIGWPFIKYVNGWSFDDYRSNFSNTTVSDNDYHPNEFGQQIFADLFINKWKHRHG